jgi:GNAT superfamily N-acetyltransferase
MEVRPAHAGDVPVVAAALARAFHDDPVVCWCYGASGSRDRWARRFFDWQLRRLLAQEVTWTTASADGAALWALPDRWREGPADLLRLVWATAPGIAPRLLRTLRGLGQVESRHPEERHLYLAVLGVDPARQGEGVGSALLGPGLELCDREVLPAYLETATERNVAFYTRHGFRVTDEVALPNGPTVWTMWRDPR